jgi:hypothetical protein
MLDRPTNQAAGLLDLASPQGTRLMAMVSHGDDQSELPLLWRVCSSLVDFGYAVTVLDATTRESDSNPGLEQLLEYAYWRAAEHLDDPQWTVIPAATGLQTLAGMPEHKEQSLQHLGRLFQHEGAILVYGKADWLVPLLSDSGLKPLLAVAPMKTSLLTSYQALKVLLLKGRLEPTIVNVTQERDSVLMAKTGTVVASLSDCARNFLGYEVNALNIATPFDDDRPCVEIQHLALRMIESALPLESDLFGSMPQATGHSMDIFSRTH